MKLTWKGAAAAVLLASGMALAQGASTPATPSASANSAATSSPDYVIGPLDSLSINVWKEPDLTATLPVRPDGKISLPLLEDVQAAGLTPTQLALSLTEKLKKFVADPRVTVVVAAINSKRVYLVGEVSHPGPTSMTPNMTVLQALSSAGLTQFANTKKIYVLRTVSGKQEKLPVDYRRLLKGELIDRNYILQPGDTIVVP
jgi:polysaccharide biosynthesis/export protein